MLLEVLASEYRSFVQDMVYFVLLGVAIVWGAGPERASVTVWLVFFEGLPGIYRAFWRGGFQLENIDPFYGSMDMLAALCWIALAVNSNRNYLLGVAALQLLVVMGHIVRGLIEVISPVSYATMMIAPGWLQLLLLWIGLARHIRRRKRHGPYRDWRVPVKWWGLWPAGSSGLRP